MKDITFQPGDIIVAALSERNPQGHEQEGKRPVVVIGIPNCLGNPRFPMITVVPLTDLIDRATGERKLWVDAAPELYPILSQGTANLRKDSVVLLDQISSIDCNRIRSYYGRLTQSEYEPILRGIEAILGFRLPLQTNS